MFRPILKRSRELRVQSLACVSIVAFAVFAACSDNASVAGTAVEPNQQAYENISSSSDVVSSSSAPKTATSSASVPRSSSVNPASSSSGENTAASSATPVPASSATQVRPRRLPIQNLRQL